MDNVKKIQPRDIYPNINVLKGKTIISISVDGEDSVNILTGDGNEYSIYHSQSCCESVAIDSVTGDIEKMIGEEIVEAHEDSQPYEKASQSGTETIYTLKTKNNSLIIHWIGESNGYYSETPIFVHNLMPENQETRGF